MNGMVILALGDDSWRAILKHTLDTMNLDVREVNQGPQAIKDVAVLKPNLVIVDDTLPYLNGYQFCRLLKFGLHLDIPLVLVISSELKMDQFWGSSCGADYCLSKPIDLTELKRIIQQDVKGRKVRHSFFQPPIIIGRSMSDLDILKMANDLLDRHLFQEKVLNELKSVSRQVDSIRDLVWSLMPILNSLFPFRSAVIFLYHEARANLLLSVMEEIGQDRVDSSYACLLAYIREKEGIDLSLDDISITLAGPVIPDPEAELEDLKKSDISIFCGKELRNAICCVAFDGLSIETFPEEEVQTFHLILQQVLETIEEKAVFEKSIPFSIIDTVTHETNRSFFLKILAQNMEQALRLQFPLALVGLSLENYQHIVNSLDKKAEFHFRQNISTTLLNAVRKMDVIARIDENKFILILFKANAEQARTVYQRVKTLLEDISSPDLPEGMGIDFKSVPIPSLRIQGGFCPYDPFIGLQAEDFLLVACSRIWTQASLRPLTEQHPPFFPQESAFFPQELPFLPQEPPLFPQEPEKSAGAEGDLLEDLPRVENSANFKLLPGPTCTPDPTCTPGPTCNSQSATCNSEEDSLRVKDISRCGLNPAPTGDSDPTRKLQPATRMKRGKHESR
jgi:diguanylate cyclase (GGDEF)-like protein